MKITVALVSASVGLAVPGELGQTIIKRAAEGNPSTTDGYLAPEDSFIFKVQCSRLTDGNCTLARWLITDLEKHSKPLAS